MPKCNKTDDRILYKIKTGKYYVGTQDFVSLLFPPVILWGWEEMNKQRNENYLFFLSIM
jgi:hypothetical protein